MRMADFRVELDAEKLRAELQRDRHAVLVFAQHRSARRRFLDGVGVAHPDLRGGAESGEKTVVDAGDQLRRAIFAGIARGDEAAQFFG